MENNFECPKCCYSKNLNDSVCNVCNYASPITTETSIINETRSPQLIIADYQIGDSVLITNQEHPFHNEIALVSDLKHLFVRLELNGLKIWMPNEWVKKYD